MLQRAIRTGTRPNYELSLGRVLLKVLVIGSGGREHALAWRLAQGGGIDVYAAPGNPGLASVATVLPIPPTNVAGLASAAAGLGIDLTVVGPEAPLAAGLVDAFAAQGLRVFGPTAAAAQIEASKAFAKSLMRRWRIPTADFEVFDNVNEAISYVRRARGPIVVKADGLAAGKGVVVARTVAEAEMAVADLMVRRVHGSAGTRVVIEECLEGEEASVLAFVSGERVWPLPTARDYKRAGDDDRGPNTGGMGAIAPVSLEGAVLERVIDEILQPAAAAMVREERPYAGVLYAGIIVTAHGPKALEFNCRFGDPEAQVILPLLASGFAGAMLETLEGGQPDLRWRDGAAVCIVLASGGYPGAYDTGVVIHGLPAAAQDALIFQAGTAMREGQLVTAGGRVLNVVGIGPTLHQARERAYAGVSRISFERMQYRSDIGRSLSAAPDLLTSSISQGAY